MFDCSAQIVTPCDGEHKNCGCVIDTSPERLELTFNQWLAGNSGTLLESCHQSAVSCGPNPRFTPGYQSSFYAPPSIEEIEQKPCIDHYEPNHPSVPYVEMLNRNAQVNQVNSVFPMEKNQNCPEVDYSKMNTIVDSSVAGSSYAIVFPAKKIPKKRTGTVKCHKGKGKNLYGREYCPGRPLEMDVREEIVQLFQQNMKVNQISKMLQISHGCVSKIIKRFKLTGNVSPASSPEQRRPRRAKKSSLPCAPEVLMSGDAERLKMTYLQYPLQKSYSVQ